MSSADPRKNAVEFYRSAWNASIPRLIARLEYKFRRPEIDGLILQMRHVERMARANRKRLEALRDKVPARVCPQCDRPVFGRPDKAYCSDDCRVRAHRERQLVTDKAVLVPFP